jgi:multimeric flavodoxin WrbA
MEFIAQKDSQAEFQVIHLIDEKLPFCLGCSTCFRLGHEKCPHFTQTGRLLQAIEAADGVIFSSSAFFTRETALVKNVMDHFCFLLHRPRFFTKKALVLVTTGGVGGGSAAKSIAGFLTGIGFNRCCRFSVAAFSWNDYKATEKTKRKLKKTAERFEKDIASKRLHSPSILAMIPYNLFRGMSLHYAKGTEYATQDGIHWLEDVRRKSVFDKAVPVPFYLRPLGQMFYGLGKTVGKKIMVT